MTAFLAGLAVGFAGSVHCVGMCGPLVAMAAPRGWRRLAYHAGRVGVYVLVGLGAGAIGGGVASAGFGRSLAFVMAAVLVMQAIARIGPVRLGVVPHWMLSAARGVSGRVAAWTRRHPTAGPLALGVVNGLLPCGLVYAATAAAVGFGSLTAAVSFMAGFGIGTTPSLVALTLSIAVVQPRGPKLARFVPALLVLLAILLVARGLQLPTSQPHVH